MRGVVCLKCGGSLIVVFVSILLPFSGPPLVLREEAIHVPLITSPTLYIPPLIPIQVCQVVLCAWHLTNCQLFHLDSLRLFLQVDEIPLVADAYMKMRCLPSLLASQIHFYPRRNC
ncbi:hypothetical protein DMENIID0001_089590 [Sergentomyia squamirostris]